MRARLLLTVLLAVSLGGCSVHRIMAATSPDRILGGMGIPRGFATDALFPDSDPGTPPHSPPGACNLSGCAQAPQFCAVRGYRPGTAAYDRCLVSVQQNLRGAGP